jgi:predicted XRE-type DNA-binding protein
MGAAVAVEGWGVTQPPLNGLLRVWVERFNLEALIGLAERAGLSVRLGTLAACVI